MTIRGSQVIPVYPLTEDIQPGDIFLVQVPIDRQQEIYDDNGFLPLDNHLARLDPGGYNDFYSHSFLSNRLSATNLAYTLPRDWIRPHGLGLYYGTNGSNTHSWLAAPRAAFPSYGFSVNKGQGLNLAVPVQGVPVGLSLLASDAASGTIQIQDARTLGIDTLSLYDEVKAWAANNTSFLRHVGVGSVKRRTNYLRVVTRVYATGRMVVTLKDASNQSAGLDVGAPKPVNLLMPELPAGVTTTAESAAANYTNAFGMLQAMVTAASAAKDAAGNLLPGGSLRLAAASSRSVSLDETFDPPLILGYLGFDCTILPGGILGPPIPTHAVLDPTFNLEGLLAQNPVYGGMIELTLYKFVKRQAAKGEKTAQQVVGRMDDLGRLAPLSYSNFTLHENQLTNSLPLLRQTTVRTASERTFSTYHQYRSTLRDSINELEKALVLTQFGWCKGPMGTNNLRLVAKDDLLFKQLANQRSYYETLRERDVADPKLQAVIGAVHHYYVTRLLE